MKTLALAATLVLALALFHPAAAITGSLAVEGGSIAIVIILVAVFISLGTGLTACLYRNDVFPCFQNKAAAVSTNDLTPVYEEVTASNVGESTYYSNEFDGPVANFPIAPNEAYGHFDSRVTSTNAHNYEKVDNSNYINDSEFDRPTAGIQIVPNEAYGHFRGNPRATNQEKASSVVVNTASTTPEYDYIH